MFWTLAFAPAAAAVVAFAILAVRVLAYRASSSATHMEPAEARVSLRRYAPASRLLARDDFQFLEQQPGYRPEVGRKWRKSRRRIFRMYVRELAAEFHRLHAAARTVVAASGSSDSILIGALMRQQVRFWLAMILIEARLLLPGPARIDLTALTASIEAMRLDLTHAAPRAA